MNASRAWLFVATCLLCAPLLCCGQNAASKPNIMIVLADDMSWIDAGCYGNKDVKTPRMDQLASEGMRFTHCFTATAMCAPTRQQLYTGLFPMRNGAVPNGSTVKPGTRSIVHHLKDLGYTVVLKGKSHVGPKDSFPFEEHSLKELCESGKPFCFIFASHNPHLMWSSGSVRYDPDQLTVPPHLLDTPETRKALAMYYREVSALDEELGHNLDILKETGQDKNTLVLFTSEQGNALPRAKWTCYDMGLRTALIARWPGKVKAGSVSDAMVRYVDVVPTLVEFAGGDPKQVDTGREGAPDGGNGFDGSSFAGVLTGTKTEHAQWTYGIQTKPGVHMRSVRSRQYKYILNMQPGASFSCKAWNKEGPKEALASWETLAKTDKAAESTLSAVLVPPDEMLFAIDKDPYELNNLAGQAGHEKVLEEMRAELANWMKQQGDNDSPRGDKGIKKKGKDK